MFAINKKHWVWRVWFEIDSLLLCQIFFLLEAGHALGTAEDGTITRYNEEIEEPDRWWRRWTCHCIYIYMILYMLLLLCLPFPRFLLTSTAHMPMADRCTVMAFADPWNSFHLATKCDEDLAGKRHRSRVTVTSVSHCKSLWVTGHEANPAWNWVGLGPQPEGRKISIKLAHDKSQTKTPHTSPYCIPYTGWWVVFRVTFRSAPFSLFESLLKVSESGQSGWTMVSSDLRIKHAAA